MSTPNNSSRFTIDGFTPDTGSRRVGFSERPKLDHHIHRNNVRPPSLHRAEPGLPLMDDPPTQPQARGNFPEFNMYRSSADILDSDAQTGRRSGDENTRPRRKRGFFKRLSWKKLFKRAAIVLAIFIVLCLGWLGWKVLHNTNKVFGGSSLIGFLSSTKLKGEDQGRVNILLAGVSSDDPGHDGANLTDSIMLVSLDTQNHKAFLLSIPRDLWVKIPGYGHAKINAANVYGDDKSFSEPGYPTGGMGLLEQTIAQYFQLPINYYAKINYSAFRDGVNAVGGLPITIQSPDKRGLYDPNINKTDGGPLRLPNGPQVLNGQTALNLARARGDPTGDGRVAYGFPRSDFDRTDHQRQMLIALKTKVTSPGVITNPIKIGQLFDTVGNNLKTDFQPGEIHRLYDLGKEINNADIQSVSLNSANGKNLLANYSSAGESSLIPSAGIDNFSAIQQYLKKLLSSDQVATESAKVVILNGGTISGLATKEREILTSKGMDVIAAADAPKSQAGNTIIDQSNNSKPATKAKLQSIFNATVTAPATPSSGYPSADFIVVLGTSQTMPQ